MIRQKSFLNEKPTLYIVPTPIGNLDEMTPRSIEILRSVDVVAAEDTRVTLSLFNKFDIKTRVVQHQAHNEQESSVGLINLLSQGYNVALVSDAGYPLISDPGQNIVNVAIEKGYNVVSLSGCNAALNALVASGLQAQPHVFIGFLSTNNNERIRELNSYKNIPMTLIFYEAPHRIEKMIKACIDVLGDRKACLARELTKYHEEFIRGSLNEILEVCDNLKGEMVLVVEGFKEDIRAIDMGEIMKLVDESIGNGLSTTDAIKEVSKKTGVKKNLIYESFHNRG